MTKWRSSQLQKVYELVVAAGGAGLTRSDVAKQMGLQNGVYVTNLLREIVASGHLTETWEDDRRRPAYVYRAVAR